MLGATKAPRIKGGQRTAEGNILRLCEQMTQLQCDIVTLFPGQLLHAAALFTTLVGTPSLGARGWVEAKPQPFAAKASLHLRAHLAVAATSMAAGTSTAAQGRRRGSAKVRDPPQGVPAMGPAPTVVQVQHADMPQFLFTGVSAPDIDKRGSNVLNSMMQHAMYAVNGWASDQGLLAAGEVLTWESAKVYRSYGTLNFTIKSNKCDSSP